MVEKYMCTICGYVYDAESGDPEHEIEPGTQFQDLPETWVCPVCSSAQDVFVKI